MNTLEKCTEFLLILKPSPIAGLGVFAVNDIPQGTPIFSGKSHHRKMHVKDIPSEFLKYCIFINDEECSCPERFECRV